MPTRLQLCMCSVAGHACGHCEDGLNVVSRRHGGTQCAGEARPESANRSQALSLIYSTFDTNTMFFNAFNEAGTAMPAGATLHVLRCLMFGACASCDTFVWHVTPSRLVASCCADRASALGASAPSSILSLRRTRSCVTCKRSDVQA